MKTQGLYSFRSPGRLFFILIIVSWICFNKPVRAIKIDKIIGGGKRHLTTHLPNILIGSTGDRLWVDFLSPEPGFVGCIDYIHKVNIPELYSFHIEPDISLYLQDYQWYPSHTMLRFASEKLQVTEYKFITRDDCAANLQTWANLSTDTLKIKLLWPDRLFQKIEDKGISGIVSLTRKRNAEETYFRFSPKTFLAVNDMSIISGIELAPGETKQMKIFVSFDLQDAEQKINKYMECDDALALQISEYQNWFDHVPVFECSDDLFNKTWAYRWFILRHNLARPGIGFLKDYVFYEGRGHKMTKTPWAPKNWEFSKLIPFSVPLHILESRWYPNTEYTKGTINSLLKSQSEDGRFHYVMTHYNESGFYYNFSAWAMWQFYLVHPDKEFLKFVIGSFHKQVSGWEQKFGSEDNPLITVTGNGGSTGKEFQPGYWYFNDFKLTPESDVYIKDKLNDTAVPLKRVDASIYHYLNLMGVASMYRELGNLGLADDFYSKADLLAQSIMNNMWDEDTAFFYDLHANDGRKAYVKNIVGFYPFYAKIAKEKHLEMWDHLFNTGEFWTFNPFPSTSADCPVYSAEGGWRDIQLNRTFFIKGRMGCVWNGPTWPYTNSMAIDAFANAVRMNSYKPDWRDKFQQALVKFCLLHYKNHDLKHPGIVEHYNSQTGEPLSDEIDYNHSYLIDIFIKNIAGVIPTIKGLRLDPIDIGLDFFVLDHLRYKEHALKITWKKAEKDIQDELEPGYCLYVDGKLRYKSSQLSRSIDIKL